MKSPPQSVTICSKSTSDEFPACSTCAGCGCSACFGTGLTSADFPVLSTYQENLEALFLPVFRPEPPIPRLLNHEARKKQ